MQLGEMVRVRAPEARREEVGDLVRGLSVEGALNATTWREALRHTNPVVLGPAAHFLTDTSVGPSGAEIPPALPEVQRLAALIAPEEVDESGVLEPDVDRFGLWVQGGLVAVSSLSGWVGGRTDVGLLVAPEFRGRGLGRDVAAIALNAAIRNAGLARWRCREDNIASVGLARGFGLQPYGRNLGIRLQAGDPAGIPPHNVS